MTVMAPLFRRKPTITEQRAFRRFQAGLKVAVVEVAPDVPLAVAGVIEDLSGGGMRLRLDREFEPGTRLSVGFALPGEITRNDSTVEVLACEPSSGGKFVARCRFVELRLGAQMLDWILGTRM